MPTSSPSLLVEKRFHIGPLTVNGRTRVVSGGGDMLALPPRAIDVLLVLLDHAGEVVSKDHLKRAVWNDLSIDEGNLSKNIYVLRNALRETLGEEVIATFSRRGYKYTGTVELEEVSVLGFEEVSSRAEPNPEGDEFTEAGDAPLAEGPLVDALPAAGTPGARRRHLLFWSFLVSCGLAVMGSVGLWLHHRQAAAEASPTVAHLSDLVTDWKPVTFLEVEDQLGAQALSPSGNLVAYRDRAGTFVRPLDGGVASKLSVPNELMVDHISWFPDERSLLVSGERGPAADVGTQINGSGNVSREAWIVAVNNPTATPLLQDAALASVSPDGHHVAFVRASRSELWVSDANGQNSRLLKRAVAGETILCVLWSPGSDRIVIDRDHAQAQGRSDGSKGALDQLQQQHQWAYESYNASSGELLASEPDLHFESGALLPDGRFLYPEVGPIKEPRLKTLPTDLRTGRILPGGMSLAGEVGQYAFGLPSISASRDGRKVAAILDRSSVDVYAGTLASTVAGHALADTKRLTHHAGTGYPTAWTPDGKSLLFDEGDGGRSVIALWGPGDTVKVVADTGGRAVQGQFTPDGGWILFLHYGEQPGQVQSIDRVPATGGQPQVAIKAGGLEDFHCSRSSIGRCLFRVLKANHEYGYVEFDAVNGIGRELAHSPVSTNVLGDWSLSPDGMSVATADHDPDHPTIQVLSLPAFGKAGLSRSLEQLKASKVIAVPGYGTVLGPSWDASGKGCFVSTHSSAGYFLLHVDLEGKTTLLTRSLGPIWGVPSRDGKKLAFPGLTPRNTNIWIGKVN